MSWDGLMEKVDQSKDFKTVVMNAKSVLLGKTPPPEKAEGVDTQSSQGIVVERSYVCITEREMKKECGLGRVPRSALKACNSILLPTPDGKSKETAYLFLDPDQPYRKCKFSISLASTLNRQVLDKTN
eukprot:1557955-Amphidinium_carterae.1